MPGQHTDDSDAGMFDLAPVSLWLEDFSGVRKQFDQWRRQGATSLREYLEADPQRAADCAAAIRVLKVNRKTLALFEAGAPVAGLHCRVGRWLARLERRG